MSNNDFGWDLPPGVNNNDPHFQGPSPCPHCGDDLPDTGDRCPECGGFVGEPDEVDPDRLRDEELDRRADAEYDITVDERDGTIR